MMQPLDSQMAGGLRSEQRFVSENGRENSAIGTVERQRKAEKGRRCCPHSQEQPNAGAFLGAGNLRAADLRESRTESP